MPLIMDEMESYRACSIDNWYEDFQDITIRTNIVKLTKELLDYFRDEIVILPKECFPENDEWMDDGDEEEIEFSFPEFSEIVSKNLKSFARRSPGCFIKTNWHAPIDAKWINTGQSLCVKQLDEFYQLIKASDILKADFFKMGEESPNYVIAFREYLSNIHPGDEFRCYVKKHELIGITSRWWPEFFPHFNTEDQDILNDIQQFFIDHIQHKFPLENFVFDVILNQKSSGGQKRILLVDFAPLLKENFKKLAFGWDELNCDVVEFATPEFRYLEHSVQQQQQENENDEPFAEIQPNLDNYKYGFPIDFQQQSLSDLIPELKDFFNKD